MGATYIIETIRCRLRPLEPDDAEKMYALNLDPEVIRFTGDASFSSVDEARTFLKAYDQYKKYGIGRWVVERKEDKEVIGWCGLKFHPDDDLYDIGYRFFRKYWGQGYATETAGACLQYGREQLGLAEVYAHAMTGNIASWKVLEKIGMKRMEEIMMDGEPAYLYKVQF